MPGVRSAPRGFSHTATVVRTRALRPGPFGPDRSATDQRNLYALDNPPERPAIAVIDAGDPFLVIGVIEVTSEEPSTLGRQVGLNPLAKQIVTFST